MIYGAIAGDIIGSRFEFDVGPWTKNFELFTEKSTFTDDTVMTIAVAHALSVTERDADEDTYKANFIRFMQAWGKLFPNAGYGTRFIYWLTDRTPEPYNSFGNGSAMRVSPIGWAFDDLGKTRKVARWSAEVSHNHPEGIKGAEATATAIWMARNGFSKDDIITRMTGVFDYDLSRTLDEIRPLHKHDESCMDSMPKALTAFYEGEDFEDVIRNAVSLGGDADTIAAIAGAIAEAFYGVPQFIVDKCNKILGSAVAEMVNHLNN